MVCSVGIAAQVDLFTVQVSGCIALPCRSLRPTWSGSMARSLLARLFPRPSRVCSLPSSASNRPSIHGGNSIAAPLMSLACASTARCPWRRSTGIPFTNRPVPSHRRELGGAANWWRAVHRPPCFRAAAAAGCVVHLAAVRVADEQLVVADDRPRRAQKHVADAPGPAYGWS